MNFYSTLIYTSLVLSLAACNGAEKQEQPQTLSDQAGATGRDNTTATTTSDDSIALTTLVRKMYEWHETSLKGTLDFDPKKTNLTDTLYSGIDWTAHNNILNKLKKSHFFTAEFLENYQNIAQQIDTALKNGTTVWPVGELPSFGNDANPWCNYQDHPDDHSWKKLTLSNIQFNKNEASFQWVMGGVYKYTVKAKKENSIWKITYLEGFNPKNYAATD